MSWYGDAAKWVGDFTGLTNDQGHKTTAQGAKLASEGFGKLSQDAWGRQMEGMGKAMGAYDPSNAYWYNTYGSRGPGAMENAFSQYGQNFMRPTNSGNAFNQYQQFMDQSPMSYGAMNRAGYLAGGEVDYSSLSNQLNGPGAAQQQFGRSQGGFNAPGSMENWFAQNQNAFNRSPTAMQTYDLYGSQLSGPGRSEQYVPGRTATGANYQEGLGMRLAGPAEIDRAAGEVGGKFRNASMTSDYARGQIGSLQGPGTYEQFVQSDIMGNNPALQMETQEGLAQLNQELAKRGHFKSGGGEVALGKFLGTMGAKSYENRANRAQQAQQMQHQRIGAGQGLSQASDQGSLAQGSALQGLASARDSEFGRREDMRARAAGLTQQENLANERLSFDANVAADQARNARLNTLQGMASAGDNAWINQMNAAGNFANQAQSAQLARLMGGMNASNMSDQAGLQRLMSQYGMANQANDQNLARAQLQWNMGQGMDATNLARFAQLGQMGNMADDNYQQGLVNYFNGAQGAQSAESQRLKDAFQSRFGIDSDLAGLISQNYGRGNELSSGYQADALQALANYYAIMGGGQSANHGRGWGMAKDAGRLYANYQTGGMSEAAYGGQPYHTDDPMKPTRF